MSSQKEAEELSELEDSCNRLQIGEQSEASGSNEDTDIEDDSTESPLEASGHQKAEENRRIKSCQYYPVVGAMESIIECQKEFKLAMYAGYYVDPRMLNEMDAETFANNLFHSSLDDRNIVACYIERPKDENTNLALRKKLRENGVYVWLEKIKQPAIHYYALDLSNPRDQHFFNSNRDELMREIFKRCGDEINGTTVYYKRCDGRSFVGDFKGRGVPSEWKGVILNSRQTQQQKFQKLKEGDINVILQRVRGLPANSGEVEVKSEPKTENLE